MADVQLGSSLDDLAKSLGMTTSNYMSLVDSLGNTGSSGPSTANQSWNTTSNPTQDNWESYNRVKNLLAGIKAGTSGNQSGPQTAAATNPGGVDLSNPTVNLGAAALNQNAVYNTTPQQANKTTGVGDASKPTQSNVVPTAPKGPWNEVGSVFNKNPTPTPTQTSLLTPNPPATGTSFTGEGTAQAKPPAAPTLDNAVKSITDSLMKSWGNLGAPNASNQNTTANPNPNPANPNPSVPTPAVNAPGAPGNAPVTSARPPGWGVVSHTSQVPGVHAAVNEGAINAAKTNLATAGASAGGAAGGGLAGMSNANKASLLAGQAQNVMSQIQGAGQKWQQGILAANKPIQNMIPGPDEFQNKYNASIT